MDDMAYQINPTDFPNMASSTLEIASFCRIPRNGKVVCGEYPQPDIWKTFTISYVKQLNLGNFSVRLNVSTAEEPEKMGLNYAFVIHNGVRYCCFIDGYERVNDNVCIFHFTVDVWHTTHDINYVTSAFIQQCTVADDSAASKYVISSENVPTNVEFATVTVPIGGSLDTTPVQLILTQNPQLYLGDIPITSTDLTKASGVPIAGELTITPLGDTTHIVSFLNALRLMNFSGDLSYLQNLNTSDVRIVPNLFAAGIGADTPKEIDISVPRPPSEGFLRLGRPPFGGVVVSVAGNGGIHWEQTDFGDFSGAQIVRCIALTYPPSITFVPLAETNGVTYSNMAKAFVASNWPNATFGLQPPPNGSGGVVNAVGNLVGNYVGGGS